MCPTRHGEAAQAPLWCFDVVELEKGVKNGPGLRLIIGLALALLSLQHHLQRDICLDSATAIFLGLFHLF